MRRIRCRDIAREHVRYHLRAAWHWVGVWIRSRDAAIYVADKAPPPPVNAWWAPGGDA